MAVLQVFMLQIILLFCVWPIQTSSSSSSGQDICPKGCGNVSFVYPFGIGEGCYLDKSFEVTCNSSSGYPKAYLPSINNLELLNVSSDGTIRVNVPVISSEATTSAPKAGVNLLGTPFTFSDTANRFTAIGCNEYSTISSTRQENFASNVSGACLSVCTCDPTSNDSCYDFLCSLSSNITQVFTADTAYLYSPNVSKKCQSVSIAEEDWIGSKYLVNPTVLKNQARQIPAVLEWGEENGHCYEEYSSFSEAIFCDEVRNCLIRISSSYVCQCNSGGTEENGGGYCSGITICINGNNCSQCPDGYDSSGSGTCNKYNSLVSINRQSRVKFILIGCGAGFGLLFLLIGFWLLCKFVKRRRDIKLKEKFFKRNGGFLLQQELSSNDRSIEKTKLFTSKDLEKATDNYNTDLILGQGGQGTVYKGMLTDGRIVAVKKSKQVNKSNVGQFINEVVILSQINHRNIVQLLGCCLETEVPMLVYEFVLNGTLYQSIHDQIEEFPITWEMLLRIAVEVSGALFYLHSAASIPIYHRDIKSANILLDEKYRAKVSDFGTSRSVPVDQTHLTTKVQGTFGYLDPEYFQSSQFTEKSDVYSFGVVLVEILTRQKPIRPINGEEDRSLVGYFVQAMNENCLFEVIDTRVLKEAQKEEIMTVATLAKRCLNLNGKMRPTMKEVAIELGMVRASREAPILQQKFEEIDRFVDCDVAGHYFNETGSSSTETSMPNCSAAFSIDAHPLLTKQC